MQYPCGWVSPFGHCRIKACCQLPDTFRRLPRPSSPLTAKASTVCAYSLDHITPSRLGVNVVANTTTTTSFNKDVSRHLALASTTRLDIRLKRSLRPSFQRTRYRLQRQSASNLLCAQSTFREWWVWEDSNHRPHPYQGCALTT